MDLMATWSVIIDFHFLFRAGALKTALYFSYTYMYIYKGLKWIWRNGRLWIFTFFEVLKYVPADFKFSKNRKLLIFKTFLKIYLFLSV